MYYFHDVVFANIDELSGVLQHGEDGPLDVDNPNRFGLFRAKGINHTILPGEEKRTLLKLAGVHL